MKQRLLGRTGISVSEICLGTMTWGTQNTEAEAHAQMDYAIENGVNFFDTAELYPTTPVSAETQGRTEEFIGSWFEKTGFADKREGFALPQLQRDALDSVNAADRLAQETLLDREARDQIVDLEDRRRIPLDRILRGLDGLDLAGITFSNSADFMKCGLSLAAMRPSLS